MALFIASLNSGSNGNCYYVSSSGHAVLIDAGLSCRETEKRMKQLDLSMQKVKAIFVSHEHGDHIKGLSVLANKYKLPVYITEATAKNGPVLIRHLSKKFMADMPVVIEDLTVVPFTKKHDAADPHSFIIHHKGINVGVITDVGIACKNVTTVFKQCHAVFLEANYDEEMLDKGRYSPHLKNRIRNGEGHLSNRQALELFINHRNSNLSHLILSHLSKENNLPELVLDMFTQHAGNTQIIIASRHQPSAIYTITGNGQPEFDILHKRPALQLNLF